MFFRNLRATKTGPLCPVKKYFWNEHIFENNNKKEDDAGTSSSNESAITPSGQSYYSIFAKIAQGGKCYHDEKRDV